MKKIISLLAVLIIAYLAASPYLSAYQLKSALDKADGEKVTSMMDIPTVKQNLTADLHDIIKKGFNTDENTLNLGEDIAKRYTAMLVNNLVTPEGIKMIINEQKNASEKSDPQDVSLGYKGLNQFEINVTSEENVPIRVALHREWLSWKITHIHIPRSYFEEML